jgi:hypothetical protein
LYSKNGLPEGSPFCWKKMLFHAHKTQIAQTIAGAMMETNLHATIINVRQKMANDVWSGTPPMDGFNQLIMSQS